MNRTARHASAFSLTEMLVVAAIICLFLSLLFTLSRPVWVSAQAIACQHNLEQISQACQMHENNTHKEVVWGEREGDSFTRWYHLLRTYLDDRVLGCPMSVGPGGDATALLDSELEDASWAEDLFHIDASHRLVMLADSKVDILSLGSALTSGAGGATIKVWASTKVGDENWQLLCNGQAVDPNGNPDLPLEATAAKSAGIICKGSQSATSGGYNSVDHPGQVLVLLRGDIVPLYTPLGPQPPIPVFCQPLIESGTGEITIEENQALFLFELGSTDPRNAAYDMQDLVMLVQGELEVPRTRVCNYGYNVLIGQPLPASNLSRGPAPRDRARTIRVLDYVWYDARQHVESAADPDAISDPADCVQLRHGGRANVLFMDGHVELLTSGEILSTNHERWRPTAN